MYQKATHDLGHKNKSGLLCCQSGRSSAESIWGSNAGVSVFLFTAAYRLLTSGSAVLALSMLSSLVDRAKRFFLLIFVGNSYVSSDDLRAPNLLPFHVPKLMIQFTFIIGRCVFGCSKQWKVLEFFFK
jgi:hypothetical protein